MILLDPPRFGPSYRFNDSDVFCVLSILSGGKRIGRGRISKELSIGEGSARKLIDVMKGYDLLKVEQPGITITRFGKNLLEALCMRSVDVFVPNHVIGKVQKGILISGYSDKIFNGIEQRNIGIRAGGEGCTTWIMRDGRLVMVPDWDMDEKSPELAKDIRDATNMKNGDVLVIGGGDCERAARAAAVGAALSMI